MTDYTNPYLRLQFYNHVLINDSEELAIDPNYELGIPMTTLSQMSNIPIEIIRMDILSMFQWYHSVSVRVMDFHPTERFRYKNIIEFADDCDEYCSLNTKYNLDKLIDNLHTQEFPIQLKELILNGSLDELPIHIQQDESANFFQLALTPAEAQALYSYSEDEFSATASVNRLTQSFHKILHAKDSYLSNHNYSKSNRYLDSINQAILHNECLHMTYQTNKRKKISLTFKPLKLTYDSTENLYSVITIIDSQVRVYRLDQIINLEPSKEKMELTSDKLVELAPYVWGNSFESSPEKVKVRFYNEANVWNKVKKDYAYRNSQALYEADGFLYLEDTVYGIDKFCSWIYGFGSSAIVLEPPSLRKRIINSLELRKKEYIDM